MKESTENAPFNLISYKIENFSFQEPIKEQINLRISFDPTGHYIKSENTFILHFNFKASYGENENEVAVVTARTMANFRFEQSLSIEEIPPYFYANSIAIVFPYLRAFVSTLTVLANVKQMILPILNLTNLQNQLKSKTTNE